MLLNNLCICYKTLPFNKCYHNTITQQRKGRSVHYQWLGVTDWIGRRSVGAKGFINIPASVKVVLFIFSLLSESTHIRLCLTILYF